MNPTRGQMAWRHETMLLIRVYEETMAKVYLEGKLPPNIQKCLAFDIGAGRPRRAECTWRRVGSRVRSAFARTCVAQVADIAEACRGMMGKTLARAA